MYGWLVFAYPCAGCGKLFVIDGNWKLRYPICMYKVPKEVSGFDGALEYVDCCPNQPVPRMAFCANHCAIATERKIPCLLHEFIKHAGIVHGMKITLHHVYLNYTWLHIQMLMMMMILL